MDAATSDPDVGTLPLIEDGAKLISEPNPLPPDVVDGVLHQGGKLVLGGSSKSYKTWLLIDLGISVATGAVWFSDYPTRKGRVLYINLELAKPFFIKRIVTICDERQLTIDPGLFDIWNLRGYAVKWHELRRLIQPGVYALIVIDPIYKVLLGRDENKTSDVASLMNEIEELTVRTGAAVAFGAHYSKGNQATKESIDRIGGSGVFARDPDSILNFTAHEERDCFTVEMTLRNHPPREKFVVRWEYPLFSVENVLDPTKLRKAGRPPLHSMDKLRDLIDHPMLAREIVKEADEYLGIPRRTVFEMLAKMIDAGTIRQPQKRGPYDRA